MSDDKIANSLGLTPIKEVQGQIVDYDRPEADNSLEVKQQLDADRDYARTNLYAAIENGVRALEEITEIARQTQQARSFEVVATLIKTLSDVNKDLVELSTKRVTDSNPRESTTDEPTSVTNNLVFQGSTSELAELMKSLKDK